MNSRAAGLLEEAIKRFENVPGPVPNGVHQRQNVPVCADSYKSGDLGFGLEVWVWPGLDDAHPEYFLGLAGRASWFEKHDFGSPRLGQGAAVDVCVGRGCLEDRLPQSSGEDVNLPVLIDVRQGRENAEGMDFVRLGGLEWLKVLYFRRDFGIDAAEEAAWPFGLVTDDGELDTRSFFFRGFPAEMISRQLPPQIVERTAEAVDGISDQQFPRIRRLRDALGMAENDGAIARVEFSPNGEGLSFVVPHSNYLGPEFVHVRFGPVKLGVSIT